MEFFEKLGKKASETYKTAAEKTNKLATETKLKMKMNDNKSKINDLYKEIGKKVYEKYSLDGNLDIKSDIEEELNKIQALADEIKEFERQILDLSNIKTCENCGSKIDKSSKFCPSCGAEQPEEVKEVLEAEVVTEQNESQESVEETAEEVSENIEESAEQVSEDTEEIVGEIILDDEKSEEEKKDVNPEEPAE